MFFNICVVTKRNSDIASLLKHEAKKAAAVAATTSNHFGALSFFCIKGWGFVDMIKVKNLAIEGTLLNF